MSLKLTTPQRRTLWLALFVIFLVRLLSLDGYPLQDTTEARYAEIARIMLETNNWVTPQFDYGIPFWGKPPFATWLSAGSFKFLGVNEFAARFPSLLLAILMLYIVHLLAKRKFNADYALITIFILSSSVLFFIAAGAVIMDTALVTGITLSMVAFWLRMHSGRSYWGYVFFMGLSLGLLSKGPLTLILVSMPIGLWVLWRKNIQQVWSEIPWVSGTLLMLLLTLPWYVLAEIRTPGFLDYFIVGEHWKRFTVTGWQGDLYGSAHAKTRGTIWLYALVSFFPWAILLPVVRWRNRAISNGVITEDNSWFVYLLLWAITPLMFFTFAGNILATYALPSMVPLSLLATRYWIRNYSESGKVDKKHYLFLSKWIYLGLLTPLLLLLAIVFQGQNYIKTKSQKYLLETFYQQKVNHKSQLIYFIKRPFSAQFYSSGKALEIKEWEKMKYYINNDTVDYYAIKNTYLKKIPGRSIENITLIGEYHGYGLYKDRVSEDRKISP